MFDTIYRFFLKVPILGGILIIINSYTFDGDEQADQKLAPFKLWLTKHFPTVALTSVLTVFSCPETWSFSGYLIYHFDYVALAAKNYRPPSDLIITIYPTILGFGIGVYALALGFSSKVVRALQRSFDTNHGTQGSALIINCDMAYPLLAITLTIFIAVLFELHNEWQLLMQVVWFAFWYSALMVLEIIFSLYHLVDYELYLKKAKPKKVGFRSKRK